MQQSLTLSHESLGDVSIVYLNPFEMCSAMSPVATGAIGLEVLSWG